MVRLLIKTSRRFKCVPASRGSLSIHISMLLFRFSSDFTRKCKTAIEIGTHFDEICENFLLFIVEKRRIPSIPKILLLISLPESKERRI